MKCLKVKAWNVNGKKKVMKKKWRVSYEWEEKESTREYRVELETKRVRRIRNVRDTRRSEQLFFSFKYTPHRNLLAFLFLQSIFFVFFISFFRKLKTLLSKEMGSLGDELSLGQRRHSSSDNDPCVSEKSFKDHECCGGERL